MLSHCRRYWPALVLLATGCQTFGGNATFARRDAVPGPVVAASSARPVLLAPNGTPARYEAPAAKMVLTPGTEVAWTVRNKQDQPGVITSGKSMIGPDGTIVVGPYGVCQVGGMTLTQATTAVESQLGAYLKSPVVTLSTVSDTPLAANDIVWRTAGTTSSQPHTAPGETVVFMDAPTTNVPHPAAGVKMNPVPTNAVPMNAAPARALPTQATPNRSSLFGAPPWARADGTPGFFSNLRARWFGPGETVAR